MLVDFRDYELFILTRHKKNNSDCNFVILTESFFFNCSGIDIAIKF